MAGIQAGGNAGRLGIEIVAEVARLQQDMDRVRKLVKDASSDIAKNAKAANDNLAAVGKGAGAGIQAYSRDIAALKAQLDPAWAAQQKYNDQMKLGMAAMKAGAIDRQQFIAHMRTINAELKGLPPVQDRVTNSVRAQRQGFQQLGYQLGDFSTQVSAGTSITQAFAQQIGQTSQALQLIGGGSGALGRVATFLSTGWGIAFTVALPLLATFISKLFETEKVAKKVGDANETLADKLSLTKHSWEEVIEATREYNGEARKANQVALDAAAATAAQTAANLSNALSTREQLRAELERQQAQRGGILAPQGYQAEQLRIEGQLAARIAANDKAMKDLTSGAWNATNAVASEMSKLATDKRYAVEERWKAARIALDGMRLPMDLHLKALAVISDRENAALDLIKEQGRERRKNLEWENVTGREVARMLGTVPNGGGDGTRSAGRNKAVGGAKNSYHLIGQAIDIPLTVNGKPLTKEGIRAVLEPLGVVIKELLGPGDKGHSDHFHIAFDKKRRAPDEVASDAEKARVKAAQDMADLIKDIDDTSMTALFDFSAKASAAVNQVWAADWQQFLDRNKAAGEASIAQLNEFYVGLERIRDLTPEIRLSDVFGEAGYAIEGMIDAISRLQKAETEYQAMRQQFGDDPKMAGKMAEAEKARGKARVGATMQMLGASKKFFKEESAGYKVIMALEKALMIIEMVNTVKSIALDTTKTGASVGNAMVRGAADQAAGAAKMFSFLGPFAFPVVAAMIALLAGLGLKGGGSGGAPSIPTAEELQEAAGTGSVLGDSKAKSNSIANSLEIVADNTNKDLEYSNDMLRALRSIDNGISKLAGNVARQITVAGGMFDTSGQRLGSNSGGGFLGMFSTTTTRSLWDVGMDIFSSSVADILQNGIGGRTYQIIEQIKKKSGFLGIGSSTKTTYETTYGGIDPSITDAINGVIYSLREGIIQASKVVGLEGAAAIIDNFRVEIGRVSFKDMSGEEIEQQLNAIFSKVGDQMAGAVLPALTEMQKVGEGLFETYMRVARQYQVVDISLKSIGMEFGAVGVASLKARDDLVQLFGTLDDFTEQVDFYRENFLTEAEQMAPIMRSVADEMQRLGLASVDTIDEFKGVVAGIDLTTQAGRELFAAMMAVAPAFAAVEKYQDKMAKEWEDRAKGLTDYRDSLLSPTGVAGTYAAIAAQYRATAAAAGMGDATALDGLKGASQEFLEAAKAGAASELDYARARAEVLNNLDSGIEAANTQAALARRTAEAVESMAEDLDATMQLTAQLTAGMAALNRKVDGATDESGAIRVSTDDGTELAIGTLVA